jgi:hypothetical protein
MGTILKCPSDVPSAYIPWTEGGCNRDLHIGLCDNLIGLSIGVEAM